MLQVSAPSIKHPPPNGIRGCHEIGQQGVLLGSGFGTSTEFQETAPPQPRPLSPAGSRERSLSLSSSLENPPKRILANRTSIQNPTRPQPSTGTRRDGSTRGRKGGKDETEDGGAGGGPGRGHNLLWRKRTRRSKREKVKTRVFRPDLETPLFSPFKLEGGV